MQASLNDTDAGLGGGTVIADIVLNRPPPTIATIANTTTPRNTPLTVLFTVGDVVDGPAAVLVSGTSSNQMLVPNGNLLFTGSTASRALSITLASDQVGSTMITVTATVGSLSSQTVFVLDVPANTAPTLTGPGNTKTKKNAPVTVNVTVGDVDTGAASVTLSGTSSNPALVPAANIVAGGSGEARTLTITSAPGQTGLTTITVTASDGALSSGTSFLLFVYHNVKNDIDGDGRADLLWRHKASGQDIGFLMNGPAVATSAFLPTIADTNWAVKGTGDFNADGMTDVVWRNAVTGQNIAWLMNGLTILSSAFLPTIADTNWEISGVGDVDGDGKADVLLRNKVSGQNIAWLMNGATVAFSAFLPTVADLNWEIKGVGDVDADGKADLLWRHKGTGQNLVWLMTGTSMTAAFLPTIADTNWEFVSVGDLDGDAKADIFLRHKVSGQNVGWLMNGASVAVSRFLPTIADGNWEVKSVGDLDADGRMDIVWRNKVTGQDGLDAQVGSWGP